MNDKTIYKIIADDIKADTQVKLRKDGLDGFAVRIENEKDVIFWRPLIESILPNKTLEFFHIFEDVERSAKGKTDIKKYLEFADKDLIFCIDADYDYLIDNSEYIGKPFVFHTYVYALENIWSYSVGLKEILESALKTDGITFDFEQFFINYSSIIYDCLVYSLFSTKVKDNNFSNSELGGKVGINFTETIEDSLIKLKSELEIEVSILKGVYDYRRNFIEFKKRLTVLGLDKHNAYLFLRGHDLFDRVTVKLIKSLGYNLLKLEFDKLTKLGRENEIEELNKLLKTKNIQKHIKNNKSFQCSIFYEKIVSDFKTAFN
jgi:hypothetical protein